MAEEFIKCRVDSIRSVNGLGALKMFVLFVNTNIYIHMFKLSCYLHQFL